MNLFDCAGGLLLALVAGSTASQLPQIAKPEPKGECTFTVEVVDRLISQHSNYEAHESIEALLKEHECEHGWGLNPGDPDYVDSARAARCSSAVLDRMAALKIGDDDFFSVDFCEHFATALERAGQLDRALRLIDSSIADLEREPHTHMFWGGEASRLTAHATRLCEREGRAEKALEYANHEQPSTGCGNCDDYEAELIKRHRARLLIGLKRFDEARVILLAQLGEPDPRLVCTWIECEIGSGRCGDAEHALRGIAGEDLATVKARDGGKRLYYLRDADRQTRLDALSELANFEGNSAMSLVFSLDERGLLDHSAAFDIVDKSLRDRPLAELLAATGHPAFQAPIERAKRELGEKMDFIQERWQLANRRWKLLREPRR